MYELNSQQIDSVNGGGIFTGALIGLAVSGMKIGFFGATAGSSLFACRPCKSVQAPAPVSPPTSKPNC
ncbi:MAG TPA: hypothetical protein VGC74_00760 [Stenotrophomonas sp.]|jgi:hypothetical protein